MFSVEGKSLEIKTKRFFLCVAKATDRKKAEVFDFQCVVRRPEDLFLNNFNKSIYFLNDSYTLNKSLPCKYLFLL